MLTSAALATALRRISGIKVNERSRGCTVRLAYGLSLADAQDVKSLLTDTQSLLDEELKTAPPSVIRKVTTLNHEIMPMATLLGELVQITETTEVKENTSWMLDKRLAIVLSTKLLNRRESGSSGPDVLPVIVLRIAITRWCQIMVTSWKASDQLLADFGEPLYPDVRQFGE